MLTPLASPYIPYGLLRNSKTVSSAAPICIGETSHRKNDVCCQRC